MTFKDQLDDDLAVFYNTDEFAELVRAESADASETLWDIPAVFTFGEGPEYRGADAPDTNGTVQFRVSDVAEISAGYKIYRTDANGDETIWRVLGGGRKTSDGLEWIVPISKVTD